MAKKLPHRTADKRQAALLLLAAIACYAVVPQIGNFHHSLSLLSQADSGELLAAVGCMFLTYVAAAGTYYWLSFRRLSYALTLFIQVAGMFLNRLLPAGIGGIGVNYAYLRKQRHSASQAASVVAVNNALGIIGHCLLLALFLLLYHSGLPALHVGKGWHWGVVLTGVILAAVAWLALYGWLRRHLRTALRSFIVQLVSYRHHPSHVIAALFCSMALTLCNVLCLWFCVLAVGGDVSVAATLLVFSFGIAVGTATPTPGGLGGIEAGLVAGLIACHVVSASALAAVLLFRLVTYWAPLIVGAGAFAVSQKRGYL